MTASTIPHGIGFGPNALQIFADELGLNLDAWQVTIVAQSATGPHIELRRETTIRRYMIDLYPNGGVIGPVLIDKR